MALAAATTTSGLTSQARSPKAKAKTVKKAKGKRGRHAPPPNETRRERFNRLANGRMTTTLEHIRILGNMSRGDYEWTVDDAKKMAAALTKQIALMVEEYVQAKTPTKRELVPFVLQ